MAGGRPRGPLPQNLLLVDSEADGVLKRPVYADDGKTCIGFLFKNRFSGSIDAHCGNGHGADCVIHRVAKKKPIGYLVAWLLAGAEEGCKRRSQHMDMRKDRDDGEPMCESLRKKARDMASVQSQLDVFFQLERDEGGDNVGPKDLGAR